MKNLFLVCIVMISLWGGSAVSQTYNEEEIRQQLDKYIENPKLFFEKQKADKEKADKANQNTLKVSEEYLGLMDKKDSLLKLYKTQLSKVRSSAPAVSSINSSPTSPTTSSIATKTTIAPKPAAVSTPYRVQLAAFYRDDFSKFFGTFNKTIGVEKVDNRNVIEVQGFKDSLEALEFSQKIKKLGFGGAFVTKYDANGKREEGYKVNRNGAKFAYGDEPATSNNVEYPNYVPNGYQEIKGQKASTSISSSQVKAAAAPASARNVEYPSHVPAGYQEIKGQKPNPSNGLQNPQISKKQILSSTPPSPATSPAPKTLANITPPPAPKPASKDKSDQLDAAFDQLFKR